jgi:hypothetical protein
MCEGVFLHSNVETPYGPVRAMDGGFYRFSPQRFPAGADGAACHPESMGNCIRRMGQDFFLHTSGPSMNWLLPSSVMSTYGSKTASTPIWCRRAQRSPNVRAGGRLVASFS